MVHEDLTQQQELWPLCYVSLLRMMRPMPFYLIACGGNKPRFSSCSARSTQLGVDAFPWTIIQTLRFIDASRCSHIPLALPSSVFEHRFAMHPYISSICRHPTNLWVYFLCIYAQNIYTSMRRHLSHLCITNLHIYTQISYASIRKLPAHICANSLRNYA